MKYIKYYERLEWADSKDLILINNLFKEYIDSYGIKRVDTFKEISEPGIYYILWDSDVISIEFQEKSGPNKWLINIAYDGDRYEHRCKNLIKVLRGDFIKELNKIGFETKLNGWLEITKLNK